MCKQCGGASICEHGKKKNTCAECTSVETMLLGNNFCHICCTKLLSTMRKRSGIKSCAECDQQTPMRIEKIIVPLLLQRIKHPPSAQDDVLFGGAGCDASIRRPDVLWLWKDRVIKLGIDEHSHVDRTSECEIGKMHDQFVSWQTLLGLVPVFYIKFNPDEYDGERIELDDRLEHIANRIDELLTIDVSKYSKLVPHVEYWYYHSKASHHINAVKKASDSFILCN